MPPHPNAMTAARKSIPTSSTHGPMKKGHVMKFQDNETDSGPNAIAIGTWENEGGAPGRPPMDGQFGRRVETDRSWTVYHAFTGVPARVGGDAMVGLSRSDATDGMMSLNRSGSGRWKEPVRLPTPGRGASETGGCET